MASSDDIPLGYFALSGKFDPDDITAQLGMQPTWVERIGDPGPADATGPRLGATWALSCQEDTASDVADQLIELTCRLRPITNQIALLADQFRPTFHIFSSSAYADWFVMPDILRDLASLRVHVSCEHIQFPTQSQVEGASNAH